MSDTRLEIANLRIAQLEATVAPLIQIGVESVDGKAYSKCLCGWLEPHGSTRCGNAAHQGSVQRAFEDEIARLSSEAATLREALTTLLGVMSPTGSEQLARWPLADREAAFQYVANMCERAAAGTAARNFTERVKQLEAVTKEAQRWAEKFHSDMPEAVALRTELAKLAALKKDGK